jgi:hypothetical protein
MSEKALQYNLLNSDKSEVQWLLQHLGESDVTFDFLSSHPDYVKNRSSGASRGFLVTYIVWFILQFLLIVIYMREQVFISIDSQLFASGNLSSEILAESTTLKNIIIILYVCSLPKLISVFLLL